MHKSKQRIKRKKFEKSEGLSKQAGGGLRWWWSAVNVSDDFIKFLVTDM